MKKQYLKILKRFNHASFQQQKEMYDTLMTEMNNLQELMLKMEETVKAQVFEPVDHQDRIDAQDQFEAEQEALKGEG